MIIKVKIVSSAKKEKIEKFGDGLKVWIKEAPEKGKANAALIKKIAERFNVSPQQIKIISGFSSKRKVLKITSAQKFS